MTSSNLQFVRALCLAALLSGLTQNGGCIESLLPQNTDADWAPAGNILDEPEGAVLRALDGRADRLWLEIQRAREPGRVGGFVSSLADHHGGLILLFDGAGTFQAGGAVEAALEHYHEYGTDFRNAGFMIWALVLRECGTAYGAGDLKEALEVVDWLDRGGREYLGVERVYAIGYSTGGTVANLLNTQRELTAVVSLGSLTRAVQLERFSGLYLWLTRLFPHNVGFCQLASTFEAYGPPGDSRWEALDTIGHVEEFKSPMLFLHGTYDFVYFHDNFRALRRRYQELLDAGAQGIPRLDFHTINGGTHFALRDDPAVRALVRDYLLQFEPTAVD